MRLLLTILFFTFIHANATNYYVANAGSDGANGTSSSTAWRTLTKVVATVAKNDSVFLNSGDTWNEKFFIPVDSLYVGSYGAGSKPSITGFQTLTGFTNAGNIWTTTASNSVTNLNTVLIAGKIRAKARYPNTGYLTFDHNTSTTSKIIGSLAGFPDYSGAEIAVKCQTYIIDVSKIGSQVSDTFFLASPIADPISGGNGYFIQNTNQILDTAGEWTFNSATKSFSTYASSLPSVQISTIDTLVYINGKTGVNINGINLSGGNMHTILGRNANNLIISNCVVNNSGANGIQLYTSDGIQIINDSITNSLNGGINSDGILNNLCNNMTISGNYIFNTIPYPGMGYNGVNNDGPVHLFGNNAIITNNRVDSSGYMGIRYAGKKCLIKNNYISNFSYVKYDGGGIYTYIGTYYPADYSDSSLVVKNIITNGFGDNNGVYFYGGAAGIYMDNYSRRQTIDSNTVANCWSSAITFNQATQITVTNNVILDSATYLNKHFYNQFTSGILLANAPCDNNIIKNNLIYSANININRYAHDSAKGNIIDSNYLFNSIASNTFYLLGVDWISLPTWQSITGMDIHSTANKYPSRIASTTPSLFFNATASGAMVNLHGNFVDYYGNLYYGYAFIGGYESKLLFPSTLTSSNYKIINGFKFN